MTLPVLPIPSKFYLDIPLYEKIDFVEETVRGVIEFLYFPGNYENYCSGCLRDATFQVAEKERPIEHSKEYLWGPWPSGERPKAAIKKGIYTTRAYCTRSPGHSQFFVFYVDSKRQSFIEHGKPLTEGYITKIGQYPSYADSNLSSINIYSPVLVEEKKRELVRAIGLASHGIGIGAYVYLRRIFESLVEEAHQTAINNNNDFDEAGYQRSRMNEKILYLHNYLPSTLYENAGLYSILSIGIHELSEEKCNENFEILRSGIELILNEKLRSLQESKNKERILKTVNRLKSEIKNEIKS